MEMSYPTYFGIGMHLCVVVLTYKVATWHSTNSQLGISLWLSPATTSQNVWVPLTEELFSQYATTKSYHKDILWGSPLIFFRCDHFPTLPLYV